MAELVRQGHEQDAATARLNVLLGRIGLKTLEDFAEHAERRLEYRLDAQDIVAHAEQPRLLLGVVDTHLRGVSRRHHDRVHAFGTERVDGNRERQC